MEDESESDFDIREPMVLDNSAFNIPDPSKVVVESTLTSKIPMEYETNNQDQDELTCNDCDSFESSGNGDYVNVPNSGQEQTIMKTSADLIQEIEGFASGITKKSDEMVKVIKEYQDRVDKVLQEMQKHLDYLSEYESEFEEYCSEIKSKFQGMQLF